MTKFERTQIHFFSDVFTAVVVESPYSLFLVSPLQCFSYFTLKQSSLDLMTFKKIFLDLNVNVFCAKVLIGDTIFTSPNGDGTAIFRGHPNHAVRREYLHFSVILRPRVLTRDLPLCSQALYRLSLSCRFSNCRLKYANCRLKYADVPVIRLPFNNNL